jgi:hypothetical protein
MRNSLRLSAAVLCGLALVASNPRTVAADTYAATEVTSGTGYYSNLFGIQDGNKTVNLTEDADAFDSRVGSAGTIGAALSSLPGPSFATYCVDLFTNISSGTVDITNFVGTTTDTANVDSIGDPRNLAGAGWVVDNYDPNGTPTAWSALFAAAGISGNDIGTNEKIAIVQTAVWAIAYHATSATITSNGYGTNATDANLVLQALLAASAGQSEAVGFINYPPPANPDDLSAPNDQDMLYAAIPEPSSFAIAGLGALALLGYGWRRCKLDRGRVALPS